MDAFKMNLQKEFLDSILVFNKSLIPWSKRLIPESQVTLRNVTENF